MEAKMTRKSKHRTACDRCYELKERCERASPTAQCARCDRLSLACSTVRPVRPAGRKALHTDSVTRMTPSKCRKLQQHQSSTDECLSMFLNTQPEEKELLMFLLCQPGNLDQYVACPSFQDEQQQLFCAQLPAALPSLKDAFLACAITLKHLKSENAMGMDSTFSVHYILKAMDALRSMPILSSQDAVLCHTLGGLLSFSISSAIGVGVPDICRYCLGTTTSFMGKTVFNKYKDPWTTFMILLETMDCLVHRQKPTVKIMVPASVVVDCRLGLCLPLLPFYHDLCMISNALLDTTDVSVRGRLQSQLEDIHYFLASWQPSHLDQLVNQFDSGEIVHLLAQAKSYRLGALLLAHRLRFPFGQGDAQAEIWSKEIMIELEMAKQVTKRSVRFVTLPFIIAAVEVQDQGLRFKTLDHVDDCVDHYAQFLQKATKNFLLRVWQERDLNLTTRWFDSIYKPCPVLDSINASCFIGY